MSYRNWVTFFCLLAVLFLLGCTTDSGEVVERYTEDGERYTPSFFYSKSGFLFRDKMVRARLVRLNEQLDSVGWVQADVSIYWDSFYPGTQSSQMGVGKTEFETPYVKVVAEYYTEDSSSTMEFSQYATVPEGTFSYTTNSYLILNMMDALAFDRITYLVQEKKMDFKNARSQTINELAEDFGITDASVARKMPYKTLDYILPYFFCRHFVNDSVFYSDFKEIRSLFEKNPKLPDSIRARVADDMLRSYSLDSVSLTLYGMKNLNRDSSYYYGSFQRDFFSETYQVDLSQETSSGTTQEIKNEYSDFNGRRFVYDYGYGGGFWRLVFALEDSLGLCTASTSDLKYIDGVYYSCRKYGSEWLVTEDRDVILDHWDCWSTSKERTRVFQDTTFYCYCPSNDRSKCFWEVLDD